MQHCTKMCSLWNEEKECIYLLSDSILGMVANYSTNADHSHVHTCRRCCWVVGCTPFKFPPHTHTRTHQLPFFLIDWISPTSCRVTIDTKTHAHRNTWMLGLPRALYMTSQTPKRLIQLLLVLTKMELQCLSIIGL